jgi:hypothetical protein
MRATPILLPLVALLAIPSPPCFAVAFAGETPIVLGVNDDQRYERIEVFVTAVSGTSVYFDKGRLAHISEGDMVLIYSEHGPQVQAIVRSVAKMSGRAELQQTGTTLAVGDRAEVLVPTERISAAKSPVEPTPAEAPAPLPAPGQGQGLGTQALPEHAPWQSEFGDVDDETPLLAPVHLIKAEDREVRLHGRSWFDYTTTDDKEGTHTKYSSMRSGFDVTMENAFGKGGALELDIDYFMRSFQEDGAPDDDDSSLRVDRLNYLYGGDLDNPASWRVGRFLSQGMPEFGLIDGVEYRMRSVSGGSWGASFGAFPEPHDQLSTGDDLEVSVFKGWVFQDETATLDAGFQKTWHKGNADRDLLVLTSSWRPSLRTFLYASLWMDMYGANDKVKSGLDITQFIANGSWRSKAGDGVGVTLSHFSFPELLRNEFDQVTAEQLANNSVTRVGVNAWRGVGEGLKLSGRADRWTDQDDSGGRLEGTFSARNRLFDDGDLSMSVYQNNSKYASGPGVRLTATKDTTKGWLRISYETSETTNNDFFGEQETLAHDVIRASWDLSLGKNWDLSLTFEQRAGDAEDASTLGFFLQRRFH